MEVELKVELLLLLSPKEPMCIETYPELMEQVLKMVSLLEDIYVAGLKRGCGDPNPDSPNPDSPNNSSDIEPENNGKN